MMQIKQPEIPQNTQKPKDNLCKYDDIHANYVWRLQAG